MCGFVTIVNPPGKTVSTDVLRRMTDLLAHRGPDDVGYACADPATGACRTWGVDLPEHEPLGGVVFGHRRLSILDLTPAGHQPMLSDDRSTVLAYNGEVYNFLELRRELESAGVGFRGHCDTEVLMRAYERWGADAVQRLNGMWAFAVWDGRRREVVVSRDRFGVKPLYYTTVDDTWVFTSEIKSLLAFPGASRGHDERKVMEFLARAVADNGTSTMFRDIHALPPATIMRITPGQRPDDAKRTTFWKLRIDQDRLRRPERELIDEYGSTLDDAVRLRTRCDVPIGTMLSGGLDSTSITLSIHEQMHGFQQTFTACWPGWKSDEESAVDLLCDQLKLSSHKMYPTGETMADVLPRVVYALDMPFKTPTAIVQYLLMEQARAHGVKVVLNGHGSDEALAGYPDHFVPPFLAGLLASGRAIAYARESRLFGAAGEWSGARVREEMFNAMMPARLRPHVRRLMALRSRKRPARSEFFDDAVLTGVPPDDAPRIARDVSGRLSPMGAALWQKFSQSILPVWLRMEDRISMAHGIESRLPFMDYRLVEFAFNLPDRMKLRDGYTKYILRRAMWDRLPERIVRNRVKQRFAAPYAQWFRGAWRPMIEDLLLSGSPRVAPYMRLPEFRGKLQTYLEGNDHAIPAATLWRVLNTELWLRAYPPN